MTTVASGRCTSAPEFVESAIGRKPRLATVAVISTGRSRVIAACRAAAAAASPSLRPFLHVAHHHDAVQNRDPEQGYKPTAAEMLKGMPRTARAKIPPTAANGTLKKISVASRALPNIR